MKLREKQGKKKIIDIKEICHHLIGQFERLREKIK